MGYNAIASRRMPYDIDGTVVGYRRELSFLNGVNIWADSTFKAKMNGETLVDDWGGTLHYVAVWFFFPEKREIEYMAWVGNGDVTLQGSNDTTNGMDGTWESAIFPNGNPFTKSIDNNFWREGIVPVSFSASYKTIRCLGGFAYNGGGGSVYSQIHFYGRKASGETADDILFCDTNGNELTALKDFGDRPEGTTAIDSFKIKNTSTTKIANNVNLQLNHSDFGLSLSESGPWTATLDITSIAANSLSATVYVRNLLGPPLLILGPKAARVIASVESFT